MLPARIVCSDSLIPFHSAKSWVRISLALRREAVETLVALLLLAPFAGEEALGFEPPQERVEGALFDRQTLISEGLAEGVSVVLGA